jgi:3-oxoadipate enol-lactonase
MQQIREKGGRISRRVSESSSQSAADYRCRMFISSGGEMLNAVSFGAGPRTLVALNGWTASWETWSPTFEILSQTMRCVSFDTRGTGLTEAHDLPMSLPTLVDDVVRVLDAFQIGRCVLAGESMGGLVALHAAAAHPDRIEAVITCGSPPAVDAATATPRAAAARLNYPALVSAFVTACLNDAPDGSLQKWGEALFLGATGESAAQLLEALVGHPAPLSMVTQQVLVIHGTNDLVVPAAAANVLVSGLTRAKLALLDGAGHAPMVTRPTELSSVISSWLAQLD